MRYYYLVYPEYRAVSAAKIVGWYEDSLADGDVEPGRITTDSMALALQDAGLITLGSRSFVRSRLADTLLEVRAEVEDYLSDLDYQAGQ